MMISIKEQVCLIKCLQLNFQVYLVKLKVQELNGMKKIEREILIVWNQLLNEISHLLV